MRMLSYKNKEAINEGFDSGQVFPSAKYNVKNGDLVIVVANDDVNNLIEGYVIEKTHDVPNYIAKRTFKSSREKGNVKPSSYNGWGGKPKRRFTIWATCQLKRQRSTEAAISRVSRISDL